MCGIVGGIAERNVVPVLLEGLRRLEYRGYDSSGIAVCIENELFKRVRALGKIQKLQDKIEQNNHSKIIQQKYDYFIQNSMLADCYFYLGYTNKENFIQTKDSLNRQEELIHILKVAFDIDSDSNLLSQQASFVKTSCNEILEVIARD